MPKGYVIDITCLSDAEADKIIRRREAARRKYERMKALRPPKPPRLPKPKSTRRPGRPHNDEVYIDENNPNVIVCYGKVEELIPGEFGSVGEMLRACSITGNGA